MRLNGRNVVGRNVVVSGVDVVVVAVVVVGGVGAKEDAGAGVPVLLPCTNPSDTSKYLHLKLRRGRLQMVPLFLADRSTIKNVDCKRLISNSE